jgi:hypothetical protein
MLNWTLGDAWFSRGLQKPNIKAEAKRIPLWQRFNFLPFPITISPTRCLSHYWRRRFRIDFASLLSQFLGPMAFPTHLPFLSMMSVVGIPLM